MRSIILSYLSFLDYKSIHTHICIRVYQTQFYAIFLRSILKLLLPRCFAIGLLPKLTAEPTTIIEIESVRTSTYTSKNFVCAYVLQISLFITTKKFFYYKEVSHLSFRCTKYFIFVKFGTNVNNKDCYQKSPHQVSIS